MKSSQAYTWTFGLAVPGWQMVVAACGFCFVDF